MFLKRALFAFVATLALIATPAFSDAPTYKCESDGFGAMTCKPKNSVSPIERELARQRPSNEAAMRRAVGQIGAHSFGSRSSRDWSGYHWD